MNTQYAIGIDLGGTAVKSAVVASDGRVLFSGERPTHASEGADAVCDAITAAALEAMDYARREGLKLNGIGIGTPGIVDPTCRIVEGGSDNIEGWANVPLADIIEQRTGLNCTIGNDANMMGLGEARFGAGKGLSDVVFVTVGTGIGGAVVIGGKLFGGYANRGTELGHIPLFADGEMCTCGSRGCLEQYASTSALVRRFKRRLDELSIDYSACEINGRTIADLGRQGDIEALRVFDEHCDFLGHGISAFINIFSPQKVVIGGGMSKQGEFYISRVRAAAMKYAMPDCSRNTEIAAATLGNTAGCIGAASLHF